MQNDPNKIAKVVIPLAIAAWLGGIVVFTGSTPVIFQVLFVVAFCVAVPAAVLYLITDMGWRQLARRFKATAPSSGDWHACPTGQMATVSVHDPRFNKLRMRFLGGSLKVGSQPDALCLSTMVSGLPILKAFLPELRVPWTAVSKAQEFAAPGWIAPQREPGTLVQLAYDPNYTGKFVEMEIGEPPVFIQLPAWILEGAPLRPLPSD